MSSIMRRRSGEILSGESFMAQFLSRNEADYLTSKHTKQSPTPQSSLGVRSKSPYRASGLVLRPQAVGDERQLCGTSTGDKAITGLPEVATVLPYCPQGP